MSITLMTVSTVESAASITTQLLGIAAMATLPAAAAALVYRSTTETQIPGWLAAAVGVSVVALYLGTVPALEVLFDETDPSQLASALFDISALAGAVGGAALGRAAGDRFVVEALGWSPTHETGDEVSRLAQTVGQVTTVSLPKTIEDAPGYDPISHQSKEDLAGTRFVFPRGLTVEELDARITEQLRSDYGISVVDMRFDEAGSLNSLAVGTRAAGIGATLPPATNAVAVRADPGFSASTGDIVQLWEPESMRRVCTGELRGVADDIVTIAIDAADTPKIDPTRRYRLVTLPVNDRPDREFASLLRAAKETFSTVTVEAGSPLHGLPVGAVDLTITAIRPDNGDPVSFPDREYRLVPGDLLFVIATPGNLRRLEAGATALNPSIASSEGLSVDESEPTEGIQTGEPTATAREDPTGEDGLPAGDAPEEEADSSPAPEPESDSSIRGKAGSDSFKEIKANFDESDQPADTTEQADRTAEAEATEDADTDNEDEHGTSDSTTSFDELKSEFDSGEADWDESETDQQPASDTEQPSREEPDSNEQGGDELPESDDIEIAFADDEDSDSVDETETDDDDELVSLDEANISFDDDGDDTGDDERDDPELGDIDIDEGLQGEADDALSDDIGDLNFDDEDEEDVSELDLSEEDGLFSNVDDDSDQLVDEADEDVAEEDEDGDAEGDETDEEDEDDDDDDSGGGGGGTSFAQLKEEFESGDADWEDDVSDSPGGDMRLDE